MEKTTNNTAIIRVENMIEAILSCIQKYFKNAANLTKFKHLAGFNPQHSVPTNVNFYARIFWYFSRMKSIVLLGTGNVATNLFLALKKSQEFKIIQVFNHNETSLERFSSVPTTSKYNEILPADIYLISVKDDEILNVSALLNPGGALVVHTAGGIPMDILKSHDRCGVLYPLQTFSKIRPVEFDNIPICIEAADENDLQLLKELAAHLSGSVFEISSDQRKSLHLAAVFVNNFVNYLYSEGEQICRDNNIPFEILLPLIKETAHKVSIMSPRDAQTGPAIRNDRRVIEAHLEQLNPHQKKIYSLLTQSIQNLHGKEL